jgi:cyclohexyl-isocyanide hydratase
MSVTRRELAGLLGASMALPHTLLTTAYAQKADSPTGNHDHDMSAMPAHWMGSEKIAFLIYPKFTALDMVGPHYMLGSLMGSTTHVVAKSIDPVVSDMGLAIMPSQTFSTCPKDIDIICVPGGAEGTLAAMSDPDTIAFLKDVGSRAKFVTSVCTGSLILGAAGLLRGYKATSHWGALRVLSALGAEPVAQRVVVDRNRITGAGVTAGLDFGLQLVSMLRDREYAEAVQLLAEYDPAPPFNAGSLASAPKTPADLMTAMLVPFADTATIAAEKIAATWPK